MGSCSDSDFPHSLHLPLIMMPVQLPSGQRTLSSKSKSSSAWILLSSLGSASSCAPHSMQKRLSEGTLEPHWEQAFPGISCRQCGHSIGVQLFFEVTTSKGVNCCLTLVLLHLGHLNFFFSYSEMVRITVNFLLHFSHRKS